MVVSVSHADPHPLNPDVPLGLKGRTAFPL